MISFDNVSKTFFYKGEYFMFSINYNPDDFPFNESKWKNIPKHKESTIVFNEKQMVIFDLKESVIKIVTAGEHNNVGMCSIFRGNDCERFIENMLYIYYEQIKPGNEEFYNKFLEPVEKKRKLSHKASASAS